MQKRQSNPCAAESKGLLSLLLKINTVPSAVILRSFMVSVFAVSLPVWTAAADSSADAAGAMAAPLILICTVALGLLWLGDGQEGGWWEALCHPWRRADRLHEKRKAEREALEAEERARERAEKEYRWERRKKLIELTDPETWDRIRPPENQERGRDRE
jgi:hypothetical protein